MLIYLKETDQTRKDQKAFIDQMAEITRDIVSMEGGPWNPKSKFFSPTHYWIANSQSKLGQTQMDLIRFLHRRFFCKKMPCYMKAHRIALILNTTSKNISRVISDLVERGILIRMHFMLNRTNRYILLPGLQEFTKFKQEEGNLSSKSLIDHVTPTIFDKLPRRLQNTKPLYMCLLYFKQIYLNSKVTVSNSEELGNFVTKWRCEAPPVRKEVPKQTNHLQTLKNRLKSKQPSALADELKQKLIAVDLDIPKLPVFDQNLLGSIIDKQMMIDIRADFIKNLQSPTEAIQLRAQRLLRMVAWLFVNGVDLDIPFVDKAMGIWNEKSKGHARIVNHSRSKPGSKQYNTHAIILTYFKHRNKSEDIPLRTINRLFAEGWSHRNAYFIKKRIVLEDIFLNVFNKKIWGTMEKGSDHDWAAFVNNDGVVSKSNPEEVAKAKSYFIHFFYSKKPEKGIEFLKHFDRLFTSWVDKIIISQQKYKRETGGLGVVTPTDNASPSVMFEFFNWYCDNKLLDTLTMTHLTATTTWGDFVKHMQIEHHANFWRRESDIANDK